MSVTIDLMRHGEPQGGSRFRGHSVDDELSDIGWQQMRDAVLDNSWDAIVSSPMLRCLAFAQEIEQQQNISCQVLDGLKEIGFGRWEGKSRAIVRAMHAKEYSLFYADPEFNTPQDAEPLGEFYRRVLRALEEIAETYENQHILLVAHAGVIRAILTAVLDAPLNSMYKIEIKNGCLIRIELGENNKVYIA